MKKIKIVSLIMILGAFLLSAGTYAQKPGVAADKQKQENLEKNKKRQAELKKKFNSMTPEQQAEAKKKADAYKKSGGKSGAAGTQTQKSPAPAKPAVTPVKTGTKPSAGQNKPRNNKPVWMDPNGHAMPAPAATPAQKDVKPAAGTKTVPAATKVKTQPSTQEKPKSEIKKK